MAGDPALTPEDRWALVRRMAASSQFQRSPRLREFLLYIADRTLNNHPEEVTEQRIGVCVFQRPEHYSPGDDNIVRTSARQLRIKIRDYFETEGKNETCIIDMPKGAYVPVFRPIELPESSPVDLSDEKPGPANARHPWPVSPWGGVLGIAVIAVLSLCAVLWRENLSLRKQLLTRHSASNLVSSVLLDPGKRLNVVVSDSTLPLIQMLTGSKMSRSTPPGSMFAGAGSSRSPGRKPISSGRHWRHGRQPAWRRLTLS